MVSVEPLMRRNFLEYASYVVVDRAIPDVRDGCKPVQRRILHTLFQMDDGRFHKVANIIGETMKLHPHGDASIGDALVVLANKEYFIEKQGNFGSILTGHPAAAARYIECRLTPLARETLFNHALTEFVPSYDGRTQEPLSLPAKLPVILMLGTDGIAVGMATHILPHNFCELLEAQIRILEKKQFRLQPDFLQGGIADVSEYDDGRGKVRVRARVNAQKDGKTIVISEVPYGTTTESLIGSIEAAAQKGKIKIAGIEDRTAERVEIVVHLPRGVYAEEVVPQLYAYSNCEQSLSCNLVVIRDRRPVETTVTDVLQDLTAELRETIRAELEHELAELQNRQHLLTLEQIFIEGRVYKRIEEAKTAQEVRSQVRTGMNRYQRQFIRPLVDEDIERLLGIPIRRISAYDMGRNRSDLDAVVKAIQAVHRKLKTLTRTTVAYLRDLLDRHGKQHPRRTKISRFERVDKRAVARQHLRVSYDPKSGFFGTAVRGGEHKLTVSEFDKILAVSRNGSYRILLAPEKLLLPDKLIWTGVFDEEEGQIFTLVYRDKKKIAWAKLVHIQSFIREREYELIKGGEGKIDLLIPGEAEGIVHMTFVPARYQRVKEAEFDIAQIDYCGIAARGARMAPKPVSRVKLRR